MSYNALSTLEKTLLLPLWARAKHTKAGNPLLADLQAVDAVSRMDAKAFDAIAAAFDQVSIAWIVRARMIDEEIAKFLVLRPRAAVVNIGAGLDTTFSRVDNGKLSWFNLDLPEVMNLRTRLLGEGDGGGRLRNVGMSVFDPGWLDLVPNASEGVLFLSSGVLYYFPKDEVRDLLGKLGQRFPASELVMDVVSELGAKKMNESLAKAFSDEAAIKWGVNSASEIETWDCGAGLLDSYALYERIAVDSFASPELREHMTLTNRFKVSVMVRLTLKGRNNEYRKERA